MKSQPLKIELKFCLLLPQFFDPFKIKNNYTFILKKLNLHYLLHPLKIINILTNYDNIFINIYNYFLGNSLNPYKSNFL